ncbi:amidase [Prauserella sediminis]|uniref:Amidase n=1 Tax=Prauserella sediminis TaxID=577680 RepID=A0A839XRA4_9PSEU|nr:amidase [Prauserella sediminis]
MVKDCIAVSGLPMTAGSELLADFCPREDSTVVERLRASGALIVGMGRMDELGLAAGGDTGLGGAVLNPFDRSRTAGGSSAGAAASLHYDDVQVAIGADQGGSVRVPAAWCGVYGLKPTAGLVPATGTLGVDHTIDHVGPLARTITDLAAVLDAISGPDGHDPRQPDMSEPEVCSEAATAPPTDLRGIRLGLLTQCSSEAHGVEPSVRRAMDGVVKALVGLGAEIVPVDLPEHSTAGAIMFGTSVEGMSALLAAGGNGYQWRGKYWPELAAAIARGWAGAARLGPAAKAALIAGSHLRGSFRGEWYAQAQNARRSLVAGYERALDGVDALICPTTPGLPHAVDRTLSNSERVLRGWSVLANTAAANLTGHPSLSMPIAESHGLPVGVMLTGHMFDEAALVHIAAVCERELGTRPGSPG